MGKKVYLDDGAEREATQIGKKFMNSTDVVGDMSRAYGTDLSAVRLHTDDGAARQAAERGVDAFSTGEDVFFGRNVFNRNDSASRGLLAHELSHSLQQGVGGMAQSVPTGTAQGGLLSWFRDRKAKKRQMQTPTAPAPAPARAAAPALMYDKQFGEEGYDDGTNTSGYVLPKRMTDASYQRRETRFADKGARDLYVAVQENPQLLKNEEIKNLMLQYYDSEMTSLFDQYTHGDTKQVQNFSQEIMRGQKGGASRIMAMLMSHADPEMVDKTMEDFTYTPFDQAALDARYANGEFGIVGTPEAMAVWNNLSNEGRAKSKNIDTTKQFENLNRRIEGNQELLELLGRHSATLQKSGFYDQTDADNMAMNDYLLRVISSGITAKGGAGSGLLSQAMQRQMAGTMPSTEGSEKYRTILSRRRKKR